MFNKCKYSSHRYFASAGDCLYTKLYADCTDLCKHPVYDKVSEAIGKPLSAAMFVSALYNVIGDYHAMRDEPVSKLSIAVKMEALRLLNASLSNPEGTTGLEIMLSIVTLGAGVMVSSDLFLLTTRFAVISPFRQVALAIYACSVSIPKTFPAFSSIIALLTYGCLVADTQLPHKSLSKSTDCCARHVICALC